MSADPFEFATTTSDTYGDRTFDHAYLRGPAQQLVGH